MGSLEGKILVASPHLEDPNFFRTVVLVFRHNEEGAFGVVLNRVTEKSLKDLWEQVSGSPCCNDVQLNIGGPVAGPLMAIHRRSDLGELELLPNLFCCTDREKLEELVGQQDSSFRLYVGYAGWGEGQLEQELATGSWFMAPASDEHVFSLDDDLWKSVSTEIGDEILFSALRIDGGHVDPSVN